MRDGDFFGLVSVNTRITEFFSHLSNARSRALLLDYDGTLAPFTCDPAQAYPYPEIPDTLRRIQCETDTRLVIVTGRQACEIPKLLKFADVEVWGCHGIERLRADGLSEIARIEPRLLSAIETARQLVACEEFSKLAERKTASIAIHWRGQEHLSENILRRMRHIWSMIPDRADLRFAPFDGGIEIRVAKIDKGDAVRAVLHDAGPDVAMAYLGDDITDEDAFGALTRRGLNVLVREHSRPTLADAWIKPPEELLAFLRGWILACRRSPPDRRKLDL